MPGKFGKFSSDQRQFRKFHLQRSGFSSPPGSLCLSWQSFQTGMKKSTGFSRLLPNAQHHAHFRAMPVTFKKCKTEYELLIRFYPKKNFMIPTARRSLHHGMDNNYCGKLIYIGIILGLIRQTKNVTFFCIYIL